MTMDKRLYSRELRGLLYFEIYGHGMVAYRNQLRPVYWGINLSSMRPIRVLVDPLLRERLADSRARKYVARKWSSNWSLILKPKDRDAICNAYDTACLKRLTGKAAPLAERLLMRASTTHDELIPWERLGDLVDDNVRICMLFIYKIRLSCGVKLLCINGPIIHDVMKIIAYDEGLLFGPFKAPDNLLYFSFVPKKPILVGYDEVRRVIRVVLRGDAGRTRRRNLAEIDHDEEDEDDSYLYEWISSWP